MHFVPEGLPACSEKQNLPPETARNPCDLVSLKSCTEWGQRLCGRDVLVWFYGWQQGLLSRWGQWHAQNHRWETADTCWGQYNPCLVLKAVEFEQKGVQGWINRVEPNCGVLMLQNKRVCMVNPSFVKVHCEKWHNTHMFLDPSVHEESVLYNSACQTIVCIE